MSVSRILQGAQFPDLAYHTYESGMKIHKQGDDLVHQDLMADDGNQNVGCV